MVKVWIAVNVLKERWELAKILVTIVLLADSFVAALQLPLIKYPREFTFLRAFYFIYPFREVQRLVSTLALSISALVPTLALLFMWTFLFAIVSAFITYVCWVVSHLGSNLVLPLFDPPPPHPSDFTLTLTLIAPPPPSLPLQSEGTAQHDIVYSDLLTTIMEHLFMWAGSVNFPDVILPSYVLDTDYAWLLPTLAFLFLWFSVIVLLNVATAVVYHEYEVDTKDKSAKQYVEKRVAYVMVWSILQSLNVSSIQSHQEMSKQLSLHGSISSKRLIDDEGDLGGEHQNQEKESKTRPSEAKKKESKSENTENGKDEKKTTPTKSKERSRPSLTPTNSSKDLRKTSSGTGLGILRQSSRRAILKTMSSEDRAKLEKKKLKAKQQFKSSRVDSRRGTMNKATFDML